MTYNEFERFCLEVLMQDFNEYVRKNASNTSSSSNPNKNIMDLVTSLASKYDGKNTAELIKAIYQEAKKGKQNGTLTNADIDNFASVLAPMLDDKKRKMLYKIVNELKNI